jgi:hypothetical protein
MPRPYRYFIVYVKEGEGRGKSADPLEFDLREDYWLFSSASPADWVWGQLGCSPTSSAEFNHLRTKPSPFYLKTQSLLRSKQLLPRL